MSDIHYKIRKIRLLKNFSQDYMATQLSMSTKSYSRIECGATKIDMDRLEKISQVFGVTVNQLMAFDTNGIFKEE